MVTLLFPNGSYMSAPSADEVLVLWGEVQWTPLVDLGAIQAALSDRAWALHQQAVDPTLPPDRFLVALSASGLCDVRYGGKAKPGVKRIVHHHPTLRGFDDERKGDDAG